MKLIRHLTWQNMRQSRSRTLATILGIVLSAAMFTAVTTMGISLHTYFIQTEVATTGDFFIQYDYGTMEDLENLRQEPSVSKLGTVNTLGYTTFPMDYKENQWEQTMIIGAGNQQFFEMVPIQMIDGRLPQSGSEIVIPKSIYENLKSSHQPCEIGESLHLEISVESPNKKIDLPTSGVPYEKNYVIVGIAELNQHFDDLTLDIGTVLTLDDGSQPALWGRFYVKTNPPKAVQTLEQTPYGMTWTVHQDLLDLYGCSKYPTLDDIIINFSAVLMSIILIGSVSLIYNAFSISISERTKQFGLLSSIGATRKQIRRTVYTEALYLGAFGIPIGIFFGYMGIAMTLYWTHDILDGLLFNVGAYGVRLQATPSCLSFSVAAIVAFVTVLISAWIPAHQATKITPISAIRQTQEFKIPKQGIRSGRRSQMRFGVPAALARKYYTVQKQKYRATVISLTISMVLFVSASGFVQQLRVTAVQNSNTENFDFMISLNSPEQEQKIKSHPAVKQSVKTEVEYYSSFLSEDSFTDGYQKAWNEANQLNGNRWDIQDKNLEIHYLEDDTFRACLDKYNIDSTAYFDEAHPMALVLDAQLTMYTMDDSGREDRTRYIEPILRKDVDSISLVPSQIPTEVLDQVIPYDTSCYQNQKWVDGSLIYTITKEDFYGEDGTYNQSVSSIAVLPGTQEGRWEYYLLNDETNQPEENPLAVINLPLSKIRVGASIAESPFGVIRPTNPNAMTLVLPMSMKRTEPVMPEIAVSISDYNTFLDYLKSEKYVYMDYLDTQMSYRNYLSMIQVFSYGFIILISLICICNVFNTISTNISLRRKDFGMLRSIGMRDREIRRMIAFECMQYGLRAILWGTPLSICAYALIAQISSLRYEASFSIPVESIFIAAACILITVFITMFYAVSKLRAQNPIEAIRCDS